MATVQTPQQESIAASRETAADNPGINPRTNFTGKSVAFAPTAEQLSDREKTALANKNFPTAEDTGAVVQGKTQTGPFSNTNAFNQQRFTTNLAGGQTAVTAPFTEPQMGNNRFPGQTAEPPPVSAQQTRVNTASQQQVGPTVKTDAATGRSGTIDEQIATAGKKIEINITPNLLHNYATYTYGLTLHALTKDSYNQLANGAKGNGWLKDAYTLISSGGRWGERTATNPNAFRRPLEFKDDFYFDGLTMATTIGLSAESKSSNAIDFSFTLVEPYGLTLINRLLTLSKRLDQPNYTENPYVLQIDFFGNTDGGDVIHPIPNITKYLPIKIINLTMKVDTRGAVYECRASPYNHVAFSQSISSTPADYELTARTVGDFFLAGKEDPNFKKQLEIKNQQREKISKIENRKTEQKRDLTTQEQQELTQLQNSYKTAIVAKSYSQAYNAHQLYLKQNNTIQHETEIRFEIDPKIANSEIVYSEKTSVSNVPMSDRKDTKQANAAASANAPKKNAATPAAGPNTKMERFNVKAGENVLSIIDKVLRTSKYATSQVRDDTTTDKEKTIVDWYKVIPTVELLNFDSAQNKWATRITYKIIEYSAHNTKHPDAAMTTSDTVLKDIRKKYEYIYTGENKDILDFQINFNTLFFNAVAVLQENKVALANSQTTVKKPAERGNKLPGQKKDSVSPNKVIPVVSSAEDNNFHAGQNILVQKAADIRKSLYSNKGGDADMVKLDMRIVGDPDFIKQDDTYYTPNTESFPARDQVYTENGSIVTDRGDIFCYVRYKTPVDIDLNTGGLRETLKGVVGEQKLIDNGFTGVYKIVSVNNEFKSGRFEQTLTGVRIHDDFVDASVAESIKQRTDISASTTTGQTALNKQNSTIIPTIKTPVEEPTGSYSSTNKLVVDEARSAQQQDPADQARAARLGGISSTGNTLTPDEQARQAALARDGTVPNTTAASPSQVQPDTGGRVNTQPGPPPVAETDRVRTIDPNNLPAGVSIESNTGLYLYRGTRFSANNPTDLQSKVSAIDNGTVVTTTKLDNTGTARTVEFDGSKTRPESKDPVVAGLQQQYKSAIDAESNAQRRLNNANSGLFDDDPVKKQNIIENNTRLLTQAQSLKQDLETQLRNKGAAPV